MAIKDAGFEAGVIDNKSASRVAFDLEDTCIDSAEKIKTTINMYSGVAEAEVDVLGSKIEVK